MIFIIKKAGSYVLSGHAFKEIFPQLGTESIDPTVTAYLPDNLVEMRRQNQKHPCLLICPGGGYAMCSQREADPIAYHFLPEGYNVFVLNYSVAPSRFPTQLREVAAAMELIYRYAEEWHCDSTRVAIMGFRQVDIWQLSILPVLTGRK